MSKPLTVTELSRLGGKARAAKMTPEQRLASAKKAWKKSKKVRKQNALAERAGTL